MDDDWDVWCFPNDELRVRAARLLGLSTDKSEWTQGEAKVVEDCVTGGLLRYNQPLGGELNGTP